MDDEGGRSACSVVWVVLFTALLSCPLALLLLFGEAPQGLDGERDYARPEFSLAGFFSGEFQRGFENWFSTKYPLRTQIVEAYGVLDAGKDAFAVGGGAALTGFRGNASVIIGEEGYLYENGYINEYFGFAKKYTEVTEARLAEKAGALKDIQEALAGRGVPFCLVITPSKASAVPQYIPEWYIARHEAAPGYARPYSLFVKMLADGGVNFIDAASLLNERGVTDYFPKTSTHWSKVAAWETTAAVIAEYERQSGRAVKRLTYDRVLQAEEPPGFGNSETDIFGIVYAGRKSELADAIRDDAYYWPDVYAADNGGQSIGRVFIQGGSFADDIVYYLTEYGLADEVSAIRYNNGNDPDGVDWNAELGGCDFVVLEVNEHFVHNIGGSGPVFGQSDFTELKPGENIIDSLKNYLT